MRAGNGGRFYRGPGAHRARRSCRAGHPSEAIRALAYRHTAAAVARLRLSARPGIGMRTTWSTAASTSRGRPCASLPRTQAIRPASRPARSAANRSVESRGHIGGEGPVARAPKQGDRLQRLPCLDHREVEQRSGRGPHALGIGRVDRAGGQGHPGGARRVGHPDQGARVAGVGHLVGEDDLAGTRECGHLGERGRLPATDRDDPLRGLRGHEPGEAGRVDHMQRHSRRVARRHHLGTPIDPVLVDEHLDDRPGGQGLTHRLRALRQEQAPRTPELRHRERSSVAHARRPGSQDGFVGGHAPQHVRSGQAHRSGSPPETHTRARHDPCGFATLDGPQPTWITRGRVRAAEPPG